MNVKNREKEFSGWKYEKAFDKEFCYDGKDLGAVCREDRTVFKVWSPFAQKVELCLYEDGTSDCIRKKEMKYEEKGVWKQEFLESLHGMYYDYLVWIDGKSTRTADPYAIGCCCNGHRSMVVNLELTNPDGFESDRAPRPDKEQIIYELHIKDFSYDKNSGVPEKYRGKYKAFTMTEADTEYPVCMEYLKELGITHVQLMPFFDFGSVDEAGSETQFNWGYDPVNYNVPEGSYATDVSDGSVRIRECKEMIQALHANGIRVIMDVVYNHTFHKDSWLQRMAPGYYYRTWEDGRISDGSACGNDIAVGRAMVDNYIADSVMYWAKEYHVDGFRFDLMGLLTVELMNRICGELEEAFGKGEKMLYGEPWRADISAMEEGTIPALKDNVSYFEEGIGMFCDSTRDLVKGSVFEAEEPGFVNGGKNLEPLLFHAVTGWVDGGEVFQPKSCAQIINYLSVHDNFTLWDKLVLSMHKNEKEPDFTVQYPDVSAANKLAAFIYFTCQGNLLFHAGEEFGRTKLGESNSYCSAPELNMLRWQQTVEFADLVEYYKGLIRLRKKLPGLCDKTPAAANRITQKKILGDSVISFRVDNREECEKSTADSREKFLTDNREGQKKLPADGGYEELWIIYNAASKECEMDMPEGVWEILADSSMADCCKEAGGVENKIRVEAISGMMLGRKAGYV